MQVPAFILFNTLINHTPHVLTIKIEITALFSAVPIRTIIPTFYDKKTKTHLGKIYNCLLTINIYFHCAIWCSSYPIICCTAICSTVISVGFNNKLIPSFQYTTVTVIGIYSSPGDGWCWHTICVALQCNTWVTFNNNYIPTNIVEFWWICEINDKQTILHKVFFKIA